jgi:uncharacterized membrane protein
MEPGKDRIMSLFNLITALAALLGAALVGGIFFAFSSFIMRALDRIPPSEAIRTMQAINVTVIHPAVMGLFLGTAALSVALAALVFIHGANQPLPHWFFVGGLNYVFGTFLVTGLANVPLNNRLAAVDANTDAGRKLWPTYRRQWTFWNHIRTAASVLAALCFALGLRQL